MTAGSEFKNAISTYAGDATTMFNTGHGALNTPTIPSSATDAEKQQKAQGYLGAGFSQLGQAATMESTQLGRDGYAAIVTMMQSLQTTASAVCTRIDGIVNGGAISSTDFAELTAMNETLKALAQLSPVSVWAAKPTAS